MIKVTCAACGNRANISDTYAGRRIKCPNCQVPVSVGAAPAPKAVAAVPGNDPITSNENTSEGDSTASDIVAGFEPTPPVSLEYAAAAALNKTKRKNSIPGYAAIESGAAWLNLFAIIVGAIGWVCIILAAVIVIVGAIRQSLGAETLTIALVAGVYGLGCIITAAFLRMNASLALAVRDIARNSFR
jgi:hypothetical protein